MVNGSSFRVESRAVVSQAASQSVKPHVPSCVSFSLMGILKKFPILAAAVYCLACRPRPPRCCCCCSCCCRCRCRCRCCLRRRRPLVLLPAILLPFDPLLLFVWEDWEEGGASYQCAVQRPQAGACAGTTESTPSGQCICRQADPTDSPRKRSSRPTPAGS